MKIADLTVVPVEELTEMQYLAVKEALRVQEFAYAPYSKYKVGAAVVTPSCRIFSGVNVENHAYLVSHAEVNACAAMCAAGERQFIALVCVARDNGIPCGHCLQVTREWVGPDLSKVIVIGASNTDQQHVMRCTFEEAIQVTDAFGPESLEPTKDVFHLRMPSAPQKEQVEFVKTLLERKRMGNPPSVEDMARAHAVADACSPSSTVFCPTCAKEGVPVPACEGLEMCSAHLHEAISARVTMTEPAGIHVPSDAESRSVARRLAATFPSTDNIVRNLNRALGKEGAARGTKRRRNSR